MLISWESSESANLTINNYNPFLHFGSSRTSQVPLTLDIPAPISHFTSVPSSTVKSLQLVTNFAHNPGKSPYLKVHNFNHIYTYLFCAIGELECRHLWEVLVYRLHIHTRKIPPQSTHHSWLLIIRVYC